MSYTERRRVCLGCLEQQPRGGFGSWPEFCEDCIRTMSRQEKRATVRLLAKLRDEIGGHTLPVEES